MRIPLVSALAAGTLLLAAAAPSPADNVYLTNGKSFEGVIAKVDDAHVRIQMPGGEIRLPRASVERVEEGDSAYATYLERKQTLAKHGSAAEWLDLARWASANGLDQGAREAALKAAQLDPHLAGVAPILRAQGYVYDRDLDRYIPYADAMRRRGLVEAGGRWVTREERQAELAEASRDLQAREAADAARAASDAQRQLAELQLYQQESAVADSVNPGFYSPYGFTLGAFPGFFPPLSSRRGHDGFRGSRGQGFHMSGGRGGLGLGRGGATGFHGFTRVPGSLFPVGQPARRP